MSDTGSNFLKARTGNNNSLPDNELSEREREILRLVATGASNKEVAQQLSISANTVKVHLRNIFAKIGVVSRTEATLYAIRTGLVQLTEASREGLGVSVPSVADALSPELTSGIQDLKKDPAPKSPTQRSLPLLAFAGLLLIAVIGLLAVRQPSIAVIASPEAPTALPRWQAHSAIPTARSGLAAVVYQNQIYAIGGEIGQSVTGIVERYDPTSDMWTALAPKPTPVADIGAAMIGGRIYVPGGRLETGSGVVTTLLEVYDPRQDRWETRAPLPAPASGYALAPFEGKLYLFGGWDGERFLDSVYEYDPDRDMWRALTPMPRRRSDAKAAVLGGKIFVIGGNDGEGALSSNDVYLPEREGKSDTPWTTAAPLPVGRFGLGVVSVSDNIYVIGGEGDGEGVLPPLEYLQQSDRWIGFESPFPEKWAHMAAVSHGMYIYGIGGKIGDLPSNHNWVYQALYTMYIPNIQ